MDPLYAKRVARTIGQRRFSNARVTRPMSVMQAHDVWFVVTLGLLGTAAITGQLAWYILRVPDPDAEPWKKSWWDGAIGNAFYVTAQVLSPMRFPVGVAPYLLKCLGSLLSSEQLLPTVPPYGREVLRYAGDILNFVVSAVILRMILGPPTLASGRSLAYLVLIADAMRIATEHAQAAFSVLWQTIPHRRIATRLSRVSAAEASPVSRIKYRVPRSPYVRYYALADEERAAWVLTSLKKRAAGDRDLANKLAYIESFRIVPESHYLRSGLVRDVAKGEVFIHARWTSDPWLLAGIALRRSPWFFDPRYLKRPFYYRSASARMSSKLVLTNARLCWPFAIYQFGHEVRAARYALFYRVWRMIGRDLEQHVRSDGTYGFDHLRTVVESMRHPQLASKDSSRMSTEQEVLTQEASVFATGHAVECEELAARYTYPIKYVQEVLCVALMSGTMPGSDQPSNG